MRTNVRSRSSARAMPRPVAPEHKVSPQEPAELVGPPRPRPKTGGWSEDWSDPSKLRQMSAAWPLMWLAVPFVLAILYEFLKFR